MPLVDADWFDRLPDNRCLAEFSLWSADLCNLASDIARIAPYADMLHVDVADGAFAPSILFGPDIVSSVRAICPIPIHVHLMVDDAILLAQIDQFAVAGASVISVHAENANASEAIAAIKEHHIKAGLVLKLEADVDLTEPILSDLSMLTLLGTAIGVKGHSLSPMAPDRIARARRTIARLGDNNKRRLVAADGGIREHTVPELIGAGAQTVVLGSLAFADADLPARIQWLRSFGVDGP